MSLKTKPGVHKLPRPTRFATVHRFIGKRVAVTRTWIGESEIWEGLVTDVAFNSNGGSADLMVIRKDGDKVSTALSLAQVYAIEEIEDK